MGTAQRLLRQSSLIGSVKLHKGEPPMLPVHLLGKPHFFQRTKLSEQVVDVFLGRLKSDVPNHQFAVLLLLCLHLFLELLNFFYVLNFFPGKGESQFVSVEQRVVQLFDCLHCLLGGFVLRKPKAHRFPVFSSDDLSVFNGADLLKELIELTLIATEVEILDVNDFAEFLPFFLLLFQGLYPLVDGLLVDHPHWSVLEKEEVVLEFMGLELFQGVLGEIGVFELGDSDGTVRSHHKFIQNAVELEKLFQFRLLSLEVEIFYQDRLFASLAQTSILIEKLKINVVLFHPTFGLLDDFSLSQSHFGGKVVRSQDLGLGDMKFLGHPFQDGIGIEKKCVPVSHIIVFFPHLSLFFLLVGRLLISRIAVLLSDFLLKIGFFSSFDDFPDILKRRLHVDNSTEVDFIIAFREGSQGFF